jgi:hypothetical protein
MLSKTFLNTAGSIIKKESKSKNKNIKNSNQKITISTQNNFTTNNFANNTSNFLSTTKNNNRSITTNESSRINNNNSYYYNNYNRHSFNPRIHKPRYFPLNTVGTDKSTWYHTKTVASIMKEKQKELDAADEIMKERQKIGLGGGIGNNLKIKSKVLQKSREICLDNYMITQLREKRTEISKKEYFVEKALKRSEKQYEKDYRTFIDFVGDIKKKEKKEEEILNKMKNKKDQTENKLNEELIINKKLMEKCEIMVKTIVLLKTYGSFVHKVFNTDFLYDKLSNSKLNYKNDIYLKDKIIALYEQSKTLPKSYEEEINSILNYDESLMQQYSQYEEKVVKMLEDKNYISKEITNIKLNSEKQLKNLNKKLNEAEKEYQKLNFEKKSILTSMKEYQFNTVSEIDELSNYIIELGTLSGLQCPRNNALENVTDFLCYCKDTINYLGEKEKMVNNYIEEIDEIIKSGNEKDKNIIEKLLFERKKLIKKEKQQKLKLEHDEYEKKKKLKAIERAKRIVIKGRKIYDNIAEWKQFHKDIKIKETEDVDDNQYLYYSSEDD